MTNYLDKEGLKKFWDITKGKYSAVGHTHDDRYLKIGATAADSNKLGGYASSVYKRVMYIGVKQDYQSTVILLWKDGEKSECFANGLLYTTTYGATRGQYADLRLRFSRWGADYLYNLHFQFNAYGEGVRMRLITCTYEGEKWWAIQHTNIQATVFYFSDLGSYGVSWKPIVYYNTNTEQILNQEIYDSIVDQSSQLSTYYVGDARNALTTDIPTKLSQLSDDVVKGKYLPLSGGTIEGNLFIGGENSYVRCSSSNGAVRLYASTNRGLYDDTTGRWIVATIKENGNTMMMNGNVGINTMAPDARLHVNGTFHSVGASTLDSTLTVKGAATLNSSLTVKGEVKLSQKLTIFTGHSIDTQLMIGDDDCGIKATGDSLELKYPVDGETETTNIIAGRIWTQCRHSGNSYGDVVIGEGIDYTLGVYGVEFNPAAWATFGVNAIEGFVDGFFDQSGNDGYRIDKNGFCIGSDIESLTTYGRKKIIVDDTAGNVYNINIPEKNGTIALDVDLAKYLPLSGGTISGNLTVNGIATVQESITAASDRMVFDVGGKTGSGNETGFNFNGLVYSSSNFKGRGLVIIDGSTPVLSALSASGIHLYRDTVLSKNLKVTGNVGIGTDADAAYKLKVNGKAYFSGDAIINGDLQVNGAINNGDFYTDMDGWAYTTQLNINDGGDLVMYDSNGDKHILNLQKAIELGVFS